VKVSPGGLALGAVGLTVGVLGTIALREATLSTHDAIEPGSTVDVVVSARSEGAEEGQSLPEMVQALLLSCRLEVHSDLVGPIHDEGDGRFRVTLEPAPDETDRRQLRGCLEDWTTDHLWVDVLAFEPRGRETAGGS
jgi:hypothetical protein